MLTVPRLRFGFGGEVVDGEAHVDAVLQAWLRLGLQEPVVLATWCRRRALERCIPSYHFRWRGLGLDGLLASP